MRFKVKNALKEILIMNTNKKMLLIITFLLIMCTGISISYAFFKVASSNNNANTNVTINGANLCMSLQLSSSNVTLSNEYAVPVSDAKALSSDIYKTEVTIQNNCGDSQSFNLLLVPNSFNTMPIKALKYALTEEGVSPTSGTLITNEYILDSTIQKQLLSIKNETLKNGFSVGSGTVNANTSKTFNLYLWIDKDEGGLGNGSTMDKILNAYLTLGSGSTIGDLKLDLYHTIENRYNQDKTYLGLYTGEGADTYANSIYYYKDNVQNNNVLFGGFCWKIVRTTETGGVKIVYNGVQKDEFEILPIDQSSYTNINNDATYPYTFDSTSKTWVSTNKDNSKTGTITFTVATAGDYYLNYTVSSESGYDKANFYKNGTAILSAVSGEKTGSIELTGLTTSDVIKVEYTKDSSSSSGSDNVVFSIGKAVGDPVKSCNNTGTDSQIGTSIFNSSYNSPAYAGYMYNSVYEYSSKTILKKAYFNGTKAYGDGVTYASSKYTLTNATTLSVSSSNISTLVGKYTCNQSTTTETCSSAYYIAGYSGNYIYYYSLSGGDLDGTNKGQNYVFGSSFTYANGSYSLSSTTTINTDNWASQSSNIDTHHYTCLSSGTTCTSLYYVYYIDYGTTYYITLTGGKSVDDALNEMLYNANTKSSTSSTIKTYIDNWYKNNMTSYTEKLEDTVFCNDRSMSNKESNGWNPNGGSTTSEIWFKYYIIPTTPSLKCTNENDKFTVENSNGNGALTYPVGLLTVPEAKLANYGSSNYLNSGQYFWFASPNFSNCDYTDVWGVASYGFSHSDVRGSGGVRPSVSLKPGTEFKSGDGSFTNPFVIE